MRRLAVALVVAGAVVELWWAGYAYPVLAYAVAPCLLPRDRPETESEIVG